MSKGLYMLLIFSNLVVIKTLQDGTYQQFLANSRLQLLSFAEHVLFWL